MSSNAQRRLTKSLVSAWNSCSPSFSNSRGYSHSVSAQAPVAASPLTRSGHARSWKMLMGDFNKLAKGKLSIIVTLTAGAGFVLGSGDTVDWAKCGWTCAGTWACSAAANTCNQIYEIRNDSFMKRTMLRPLPAGRLSPITALAFAAVTGLSGAYMLQTQTNALTAGLGVANIALYASIYTPLKQIHPVNTWVGAVVGAIPPLMGWAAASGTLDPAASFMAAVLYFWQLPHFMALAWLCKDDYARGGHRMISLFDRTGRRTAGVALRNAIYMVPVGLAAVSMGLVHPAFTYESVGLSMMLALAASAFYTKPTQQTARLLFRMSLVHLPVYMLCAVFHRIPNTAPVTWEQTIKYFQQGAEDAEKRLHSQVHAGSDPGEERYFGPMVFIFSPPLLVAPPCPYSTIKKSLSVATAEAEQRQNVPTQSEPQESSAIENGKGRRSGER